MDCGITHASPIFQINHRIFVALSKADEVVLLVACEIDIREKQYENSCANRLDEALKFSFEELTQRHVQDYQSFYNRMEFELGAYE